MRAARTRDLGWEGLDGGAPDLGCPDALDSGSAVRQRQAQRVLKRPPPGKAEDKAGEKAVARADTGFFGDGKSGAVEAHMLERMRVDAEERAARIKVLLEEARMPVP
jgi:hypothetical protein